MLLIVLPSIIPQAQVQAPGLSPVWTPESVLITIGFFIIAILIAIVGFLSKSQLNRILDTIKTFTEKQSTCREELSGRFADKEGTSRDIKELYARTDRHESCLQRHSVLIGGRRAVDIGDK